MRFRFDAHQPYQKLAVSAITAAFDQTLVRREKAGLVRIGVYEEQFVHTTFDLDHGRLLENVRAVQHAHGIEPDNDLHLIRETVPTPAGEQEVALPNLSVEMETGTGKTYVYLRTALELNRRFGLKKFIVVVPSVAIREGVLKTFQVTAEPLRRAVRQRPVPVRRLRVEEPQPPPRVRRGRQRPVPGHDHRLLQQGGQRHPPADRPPPGPGRPALVASRPPGPHPGRAAEHGEPRPQAGAWPRSTRSPPCATAPPTATRTTSSTA